MTDLKFNKDTATKAQNKDRLHAKGLITNPDIKPNFFSFMSDSMDSLFWLKAWKKAVKTAKGSGDTPSIPVKLIHSSFKTTERYVDKDKSTIKGDTIIQKSGLCVVDGLEKTLVITWECNECLMTAIRDGNHKAGDTLHVQLKNSKEWANLQGLYFNAKCTKPCDTAKAKQLLAA